MNRPSFCVKLFEKKNVNKVAGFCNKLNYFDIFPCGICCIWLLDRSRLCKFARSWKRPVSREDIWFWDRFKTIREARPWKDLEDRQVSQSVCNRLEDRSITTSLVRGWNSLPDTTDNWFWSSLNCWRSGTLSKRVAGRATILLPGKLDHVSLNFKLFLKKLKFQDDIRI